MMFSFADVYTYWINMSNKKFYFNVKNTTPEVILRP